MSLLLRQENIRTEPNERSIGKRVAFDKERDACVMVLVEGPWHGAVNGHLRDLQSRSRGLQEHERAAANEQRGQQRPTPRLAFFNLQQLSIPGWSPLRLFLGLHQQVARAGRRFAPSDIDRGELYRLCPVPHRSRSAEALGPVRSRRRSTVDRQSYRRLAGEIPRRCWRCRPWERPAGPW